MHHVCLRTWLTVRGVLEQHSRLYELLEVVMDLGRPPTARFPGRDEKLSDLPVVQEDLDYAVAQVCVCGGGVLATLRGLAVVVVVVAVAGVKFVYASSCLHDVAAQAKKSHCWLSPNHLCPPAPTRACTLPAGW